MDSILLNKNNCCQESILNENNFIICLPFAWYMFRKLISECMYMCVCLLPFVYVFKTS